MDRSVLEGNPHSVIEGMIIAAYAIGAGNGPVDGYVYVRHEYPFAVERLRHALETGARARPARRRTSSARASTSTSASTRAPAPSSAASRRRSRPPSRGTAACRAASTSARWRTASGASPPTSTTSRATPTCPWIVNHGADAFAAKGTATSKGTKIFSLTGKVVNGGLIEVPMGATLRQVIFDIGGGMLPGREFKAVQLGGPSGGCLPASLLDEPIDFESLVAAGSMMGSGGMVVVDDTTCMVDFAKFFLKFTAEESCGKCVPCRVGTTRMLEILERISAGEGTRRRRRPPRAARRRHHRGLALPARRQRPQPGAHHPALLPRRGHGPRGASAAARPRSAVRSSATPSTRTPAPAATRASAPAPPTPSAASARSYTSSTRSSASSATPAARCASSTPSRSRQAYSSWPKGGGNEPRYQGRRQAHHRRQQTCSAREGETVLDVARREGIDIPALCHQEGMAAWGACRLCMVEVEGLDKLQAACTTWVADGLVGHRPTRRACAPGARATSRCTSRTTTPTARRPARTPAPRTSTSPPTWRRWPPATPPTAAAIVREELPFPGILGRVCPRYCEPVCRRGDVDEPIAICALHRAAADHSETRLIPGPADRQAGRGRRRRPGRSRRGLVPHRARPPGDHLRRQPQAGGSLRYAIPEFRLPEKVVDKELAPLWEAGVRFVGESELGYEVDPDGLFDAGFDAVAHLRRHLGRAQARPPRRRRRAARPRRAQARARRPRRAVHDQGRRDRRRHHGARRGPHGAPQGRQGSGRDRPARGRRHARRRARARRRPRGGRPLRVRDARQARSRAAAARPRAWSACASSARRAASRRCAARASTWPPPPSCSPPGTRPSSARAPSTCRSARARGCGPTTTPGARPTTACSPPATR